MHQRIAAFVIPIRLSQAEGSQALTNPDRRTMFHQGIHNYFVYITTNKNKQVLYIGVTNDLRKRMDEHFQDSITLKKHFTGRYNCVHLVYVERFQWIEQAIEREKEIKAWRREKKVSLINSINPEWRFLNDDMW